MPEVTLSPNRSGMTPPLDTGALTFTPRRSRYALATDLLPDPITRNIVNGAFQSPLVLADVPTNIYWNASFAVGNVSTWSENVTIPQGTTSISFDDLVTVSAAIVTVEEGVPIIKGEKGDPGPQGPPGYGGTSPGANSSFAINLPSALTTEVVHSLNTKDVVTEVRLISTGEIVDADVTILNLNSVSVTLSGTTAPPIDTYRLVVLGAGYAGEDGTPGTFAVNAAASASTLVTHGLKTSDVLVLVYDNLTGEVVDADVQIASASQVGVSFGTAPQAGRYRIVVYSPSYRSASGVTGAHVASSTTGLSTVVDHKLNSADVVVQVVEVSTGLVVEPDVFVSSASRVTVVFGEAATLGQYKILVFGPVSAPGLPAPVGGVIHDKTFEGTSGVIAPDLDSEFGTYLYRLTGAITGINFPAPEDITRRVEYDLWFFQDTTGGRVIQTAAWDYVSTGLVKFAGGVRPTLSTAPSSRDLIRLSWQGQFWYGELLKSVS
jgi:hypothetical protein